MKKETRFTEVCVLDICTSDYFLGYKYPVIAIPLYNGMTTNDLAEAIESEINATFEYLCNDYSENAFTEEEIKLFYGYCEELKKEESIIIHSDPNEPEDCEDYEPAYLYLSLCKPVTRYGMTFLNE